LLEILSSFLYNKYMKERVWDSKPIKYTLKFKRYEKSMPETEVYWTTSDLIALNMVKETFKRKGIKNGIVISLYNETTEKYLIDKRTNSMKEELDALDKQIQELKDKLSDDTGIPRGFLSGGWI